MLFANSYLNKTVFNWVQPRLEDFLKKMKIKNKSKKRSKCFTNLTIFILHKKGFWESG